MNPVTQYPVLAASLVAGVVISLLTHVTGEVPQGQQDNINAFFGWFIPIAVTVIGGIWAHRRVTPVPAAERGF